MAKSKKKILLVDDDANILGLYSAVFRHFGFNFSLAKNGKEAIEKAKVEKPALILLDIMLPDINGFGVLRNLKESTDTKDVPIWMLSVLAEQSNQDRALDLGADRYLVKSAYTPQQICEKIKDFLES